MMSFLTAEINGGYRIAGWVLDFKLIIFEIWGSWTYLKSYVTYDLQCIFLRNAYYTYILYLYTISMNYNRMTPTDVTKNAAAALH